MQASKPLGIVAISISLLFGATACASADAVPEEPATSTSASEHVEPIERVNAGYVAAVSGAPTTESAETIEDGELRVDEDRTLRLKTYGTVDTISTHGYDESPATEDEVFHVINFEIVGQIESIWANTNDPLDKVRIAVNGTFLGDELQLAQDTSTILVSAPEDAELLLEVSTGNLPQTIDLKTGERLSKGKADAWYGPTQGTLENGVISEKVNGGSYKTTFKASFGKATKTPWTEDDGWADSGNKSWLFVESGLVDWEVHGDGSIAPAEATAKVWVEDSEGNKYENEAEEWGVAGSQPDVLKFMVPADLDTYTIHTKAVATPRDWDDKVEATLTTSETSSTITFK